MRDLLKPKPGRPPAWSDRLLTLFRRKNIRGFVRLYDCLKPHCGRRSLRVVCRYGSQFFLCPWDYIDNYVIKEGFYESEVLEVVRPMLGAGSVLWVVGANFGLHAVTAKWLHPETRVVAFEPFPSMGARLLENCELNHVEVELQAYALSDASDALHFYANTSGNPAMSTLHPEADGIYDLRLTVTTKPAKDIVAGGIVPAPTVAIIDAEGAETEILRGFGPLLSSASLTLLVVEAPNDFLSTRQPGELYNLLTSAGFKISRLDRKENTTHALSNFVARRS